MRRIGDPGSIDSPGCAIISTTSPPRSEEHTSELQSQSNLVCRLLLEKNKNHNKKTPETTAADIRKVVQVNPRTHTNNDDSYEDDSSQLMTIHQHTVAIIKLRTILLSH